jgi:hypothetical protein
MPFPDVVIVLPGISGSVLAKDGKEIWGASSGAIWRAISSGGDSIKSLALTASDDPNVDDLGDGVTATGLIQDVHIIPGLWKIDGYSGLTARLQSALGLAPGENLFEFPYDWRRDNRVSARRLKRISYQLLSSWRNKSGNDKAKLILVAHSMGGAGLQVLPGGFGRLEGRPRADKLRHSLPGFLERARLFGEWLRKKHWSVKRRPLKHDAVFHGCLPALAGLRMRRLGRRQAGARR